MENEEQNQNIEKEADQYIELGKLLHNQRPTDKAVRVEKILHTHLPVTEKIERIKKIDQEIIEEEAAAAAESEAGSEPEDESQNPRKEGGGESESESSDEEEEESDSKEEGVGVKYSRIKRKLTNTDSLTDDDIRRKESLIAARRNIEKVKIYPKGNTFFGFIFKHMFKIISFGKRTHILNTGFLPTTLFINESIQKVFEDYIQKNYVADLEKILGPILEKGWYYLTKYQYNLVALMAKFCKILRETDFRVLKKRNKDAIDRLHNVEKYILVFYSQPTYREKLFEAINVVLSRTSLNTEALAKIQRYTKKILNEDAMVPSLYNMVLGLNMIKYRRFIQMEDLLPKKPADLVSAEDFDCTAVVQRRINDFLAKVVTSLRPLVKQYDEIIRLRAFLPTNGEDGIAYGLLENFYNAKLDGYGYDFMKDNNNVIVFSVRMLEHFIGAFQTFLSAAISSKTHQGIRIFSESFFQNDFSKIFYRVQKLQKLSFSFSVFPFSRFEYLKTVNKGATAGEAEVLQLFSDVFSIVVTIGKRLALVLRSRSPYEGGLEYRTPLSPLILQGKKFMLPYENQIVVSEPIIKGKTVAESISYIISVCYLIGSYFFDAELDSILSKQEGIKKDMDSKMAIIERLADAETYNELRTEFNL